MFSINKNPSLLKRFFLGCVLAFIIFISSIRTVAAQVACGEQNGTTIICSDDIRRRQYIQGAESFKRYHGYGKFSDGGFLSADTWIVRGNEPKSKRCFIFGPYIPLNFAGQITAVAKIYAELQDGTNPSPTQTLFTFDLTANRGSLVLDTRAVTTNSFSKVITGTIEPSYYAYGFRGDFTPNEPKEVTIGVTTGSELTDVEARVCNLHPGLFMEVFSTEIILNY